MKNIIKITLGIAGAAVLLSSCNSVLEEHPKTLYTPDFFTTQLGVEGGLTALYSHLRWIGGQAYYYNSLETGTDEFTYGTDADGNFKDADLSGAGSLNASTARSDALWGTAFTFINTANGIITNAETVNLAPAMVAEARFMRAYDYFLLVQTFGGVALDLGSGELEFNSSSVRVSTRNTVPEVYTKAIFPDLKFGVENLPDNPRLTGTVTKNVARLFLAKAYLTYAWWLENPNSIPTYPECSRTDPDGHDAKWYFQEAYKLALDGINNPGPYGLQSSFYKVNVGTNDRNSEIMLYADHTENSEQYNGGSLSYGSGGAPDNFAGWMVTWNYSNMNYKGIVPVQRTDNQHNGRPWTRMAPTHECLSTFTDRDKDSRWDGTFTYAFLANWSKAGIPAKSIDGPNGSKIKVGDPFLVFLDEDDPSVTYDVDASQIYVGQSPNYNYFVINPSDVSRRSYPTLWKLGPYRTNTTGTGQPNAGSTRPYSLAKYSEFYFIAAEAAVKGASGSMSARDLLNVIRARAGKWEYNNNFEYAMSEDFSEELCAKTPQNITVDYILDERTREYCGDGFRWFDLARTQTWDKRAAVYHIKGPGKDDIKAGVQEVKRTIEPFRYLFPIPQGQLDSMQMSDEEKAAYQNPGYSTK